MIEWKDVRAKGRPEANPIISLANIRKYTLGAIDITNPPTKKIQILISMAPRRPLLLARVPPTIFFFLIYDFFFKEEILGCSALPTYESSEGTSDSKG